MKFLVRATLITGTFEEKPIHAIDRILATEAVMSVFSGHKEIARITISEMSVLEGITPQPFIAIERNSHGK